MEDLKEHHSTTTTTTTAAAAAAAAATTTITTTTTTNASPSYNKHCNVGAKYQVCSLTVRVYCFTE